MKQIFVIFLALQTLISCKKDDSLDKAYPIQNSEAGLAGKPPPGGGGSGCSVPATPTYLSPDGSGGYTCNYAGSLISISGSITYDLFSTADGYFNDYGVYNAKYAYSSQGGTITFTQSCCTMPYGTGGCQSLCCNWQTSSVSALLLYVINPPSSAPSNFVLINPSNFL